MQEKIKKAMGWFATYLAIYSIFGFGLFIMEESIQSLQFGGWQLEKVGDYKTILTNSDLMEKTNRIMGGLNYVGGWLNPVGFIAYSQYHRATEQYVYALRMSVMANSPALMAGRIFKFNFKYNTIRQEGDAYRVQRGKVHVIMADRPTENPITIEGLVYLEDKKVMVEVVNYPG